MEKVTIVLLTFNRASRLKRAIASALKQTYENFELLIADDCSIDNTEEIVLSFNDNRIKYMKNEKNLGFLKNWQNAVSYVDSNFVIPLISDDDYLVYNKFIEESMQLLINDEDLDIVFAKYATICNDETITNDLNINEEYTGIQMAKNFDKYQTYLSLSSMVFRKKFLQLINKPNFVLDNTTVSNDQVIIFDILLHANKINFLNKTVYHWVKDDNFDTFSSKSSSNIYSSIKSKTTLVDHLIPYLKNKNILDEFTEMFNRYYLYAFEESKMNYYISKNNYNFKKLLKKDLNFKEIYLFGKGEVGLQLKKFLTDKNIPIKGFIDDNKNGKNIISLDTLGNIQTKDTMVIICSYKSQHIHNIYKKLISINKKDFFIYELVN